MRKAGVHEVFAADEEIGRALTAVDWAASPLGAPESWPQSLRTAVDILLSSRFAMWMAWGPELTFFCNAAYRRDTLGSKYPWALGRPVSEVWAEVWQDVRHRVDHVLTGGEATWDEGLMLFLERSGFPEESYHTFSYSPLRDDEARVAGVLCVVSEETDRIIAERRMDTLRHLGSDPRALLTEREMLAFAGRQLERNEKDLPFTLTYLYEEDGSARLAAATGVPVGHAAAPPLLAAGDPSAPWPTGGPEQQAPVLIALDGPAHDGLPSGPWSAPPTQALLVPLLGHGGTAPYGFLVAGLNRYRPLDDAYHGFVQVVAGYLAAGISHARGYRAERRRAEQLAELDRAKTAFFANISHEFRTPLTLIMGPVEELRASAREGGTAMSAELDMIHRNGLRLGRLVNTLLDFSRIEAGRMRARYEPVDLAAVTADLASVFRSAVERAGLGLRVDCRPLGAPVHVDRDLWEKVMLNLLSNALKFTFEGTIDVSVRAEGEEAVVRVSDTGVGVPARELPRLFERFHRIENSRARSGEGSGIGLAFARELVTLHGGSLHAESEEGRGTRFTIRLPFGTAHLPSDATVLPGAPDPSGAGTEAVSPRATRSASEPYVEEALRWLDEDPSSAAGPTSIQPWLRPLTGLPDEGESEEEGKGVGIMSAGVSAPGVPTVLVADDNADMREYLVRLLSSGGYEVRTTSDGLAALAAVRSRTPDLVVSDVMMPGLDGLGLVGALRADPRTAAVPVLLLSARAGQEASVEGLRAGADDYLVKPFAAGELLARVHAHVELGRLRNHHARWRTALVDSLQEAFFVCDEAGAVVEINAAFTDIVGYGPELLPYDPTPPWWPDAETAPGQRRDVEDTFARLMAAEGDSSPGPSTLPLTHRDGHRVWVSVTGTRVQDPDSGRHVFVGTFRDVTADHHAGRRDNALASLTARMSQAVSPAEVLSCALGELRDLWQARRVTATVLTDDGAPGLVMTEPVGSVPGSAGSTEPGSAGPGSAGSTGPGDEDERLAVEARRLLPELRERRPLTPLVTDAGAGILLEHPEGALILRVTFGPEHPFTEEDELTLSLMGGHLAQGLTRAHQIDQERKAAIALQQAILGPSRVPEGFAVRYEPASRPLKVGGDWYDTVPLRDGRTGIVVGDCVGRGMEAATVMGQLRGACRALLMQSEDPARTLMALDQFAAGVPGAFCTTVFCGVLDRTGRLTYASAGHPPGLVTRPDGSTHLLEEGRSRPIGVSVGRERPTAVYVMAARSTLLLYTDGLVERRGAPLTRGIERAAQALREGRGDPLDLLADGLMEELAPDGGFRDDVALLLHRHPGPLDMTFPAESGQLAPVRQALRSWLEGCDLPPDATQNLLVAAGEACANAIEHGHRDAPGDAVTLHVEATADALRLTVTDTGRWKPPAPDAHPHRGRGVPLMRALMQQVSIVPGPAGTTVDMYTRITP
ncbi:SpoIIE family protein phosphatase [Streptomyces sp. NPDC090303]|uniref:SpoIIE family protein phosphatase n=1 Tax=Streptomyces sp. NPDC090303 TaxID=3365960 RepID=UPI00382F818D